MSTWLRLHSHNIISARPSMPISPYIQNHREDAPQTKPQDPNNSQPPFTRARDNSQKTRTLNTAPNSPMKYH